MDAHGRGEHGHLACERLEHCQAESLALGGHEDGVGGIDPQGHPDRVHAAQREQLDSGPERNRNQIEGFLRRAAEAGSLIVDDPRLAAEQFASLVRGEIHLQRLLRLDAAADQAALADAAANAVATFLRAFGRP